MWVSFLEYNDYRFIIVILLQNMATDDPSAEIIANILETCRNGCTKYKIIQEALYLMINSEELLQRWSTGSYYITLEWVACILQRTKGTNFSTEGSNQTRSGIVLRRLIKSLRLNRRRRIISKFKCLSLPCHWQNWY